MIPQVSLENQLIEAQIRIRFLEKELGKRCEMPFAFGLTPREGQVLAILYKNDVANKSRVMMLLYDEKFVIDKILDVYIWRLRQKLKPFGIEIRTRYRFGYYIPPEGKGQIAAMLKAEELIA